MIVAGSSDNLYAVDADTGKLVWQKHFTNEAADGHLKRHSGSVPTL